VSLKPGATAADRAIFGPIAAPNGVPALLTDGILIGPHSHVDVVLSETAGLGVSAKVWWWYQDAGVWVEDIAIGTIAVTASSTAGAVCTPSAATRIYIEITTAAGAYSVSGWAIGLGALGRVGG